MSDDAPRAVRARVTGGVQGVGYRAFVSSEADRLGVAGWVANRSDGSVEAFVEGPGGAVEELVASLRRGPTWADVEDVAVDDVAPEGASGFSVRS